MVATVQNYFFLVNNFVIIIRYDYWEKIAEAFQLKVIKLAEKLQLFILCMSLRIRCSIYDNKIQLNVITWDLRNIIIMYLN